MFKLRLRFDICCMTSEERVPKIEVDSILLYQRCMCTYPYKMRHYLTCGTDYAVEEGEGPVKIFRIVLDLLDNMPEKADLLEKCRVGFARSFLGNSNRKEDVDNCILAYKSVVHLTPQGHLHMYR